MNTNIFISSEPLLADNIEDFKPQQIITLTDKIIDVDVGALLGIEALHLCFLDVEGHDPDGPKFDHIKTIHEFARKDTDIVVCCNGGVSRSSANAIGLLCSRGMAPLDAINLCFERKANIWPNTLILRFWDQLLGLNGELIKHAGKAKGQPRCPDCCVILLGGLDDHVCRF